MSEEILQQLAKMVGTNNRHQSEVKKKLGEIHEQLSQMKASLHHVEYRLRNMEDDMQDIKGSFECSEWTAN